MSPKTRLSVLGMAITAVLLLASYQGVARAHKHSSEPSATLRKELLEIRESVWRGWFNNDQKALGELLPEELIAINNGQADWEDRDKTLLGAKHFSDGHGRLLSLQFPKTEVQVYRDVAILYSQYSLEFASDAGTEKQAGRATEIFVRQNGRWVNVGWHLDSGR